MSSGDDDLLRTLHRRADVLGLLVEGSLEKGEIAGELDVSRSTVDRALRELETYNCITREEGEFVATAVGRVLLETYENHVAHVDGIGRATDVLGDLPSSAPVSPDLLADARVFRPDPPTPHTAYRELEDIITQSRRFYGLSVADTHFRFASLLRDQAVEESVPIEIVATPDMREHLLSEFSEEYHEAMTDGELALYEQEDLPFGLLISDQGNRTRVAVVVYGTRSNLSGIILNDTSEAVTWARLLYRRYRRGATPVDPPSLE
jgi:predicted transcriptional regulator